MTARCEKCGGSLFLDALTSDGARIGWECPCGKYVIRDLPDFEREDMPPLTGPPSSAKHGVLNDGRHQVIYRWDDDEAVDFVVYETERERRSTTWSGCSPAPAATRVGRVPTTCRSPFVYTELGGLVSPLRVCRLGVVEPTI
jgi:hypothetical protein